MTGASFLEKVLLEIECTMSKARCASRETFYNKECRLKGSALNKGLKCGDFVVMKD